MISKILESLKEEGGGLSSRRLVFVIGSLLAVPIALIFGCFSSGDIFLKIYNSTLMYLGSCLGLITTSKVMGNKNAGKQ